MAVTPARRDPPQCCGLPQTEAVEDALKAMYRIAGRCEPVTTSALAEHLAVTAPTVSAMLKRLQTHGLIVRRPDHSIELTGHGAEHARSVVRRHRLLEAFLSQVLNVPWDEVHAEAEILEHAISDRLLDRIDGHLGHPSADPHGDPIPPRAGEYVERWGYRLDGVREGVRFRVERIDDRNSDALRYLADIGIRPGADVEISRRTPFGGPLWLLVEGTEQALGDQLTTLIHGVVVEAAAATPHES